MFRPMSKNASSEEGESREVQASSTAAQQHSEEPEKREYKTKDGSLMVRRNIVL